MSKEIASFLILNAAQKHQVVGNPSQLTNITSIITDKVKEYKCNQQLLIDLRAELEESRKDNSSCTHCIADPEHDLVTVNTITHILQTTTTHATLPIFKPIKLPHPPEFSGDCMELLHFMSKVHSKLAGESLRYIDK
jgi:hypothetical protein